MEANHTNSSVAKGITSVAIGTGLILLVPLIAMQFTSGVNWGPEDFIVIGILLFGTGLGYVLAAQKVRSTEHRLILGAVLLGVLLLVWAELAVGIFGTPFAGS